MSHALGIEVYFLMLKNQKPFFERSGGKGENKWLLKNSEMSFGKNVLPKYLPHSSKPQSGNYQENDLAQAQCKSAYSTLLYLIIVCGNFIKHHYV